MRVAILPAGGQQERYLGLSTPKHLLRLKEHRVMDYALSTAIMAKANIHIITSNPETARHADPFDPFISWPWPNQLDSIGSLKWAYGDAVCLFVMPDTCFGPKLIGSALMDAVSHGGVAVALFETDTPERFGMCKLAPGRPRGTICKVVDKPRDWPQGSGVAWGLIAWQSTAFWESIQGCGGNNMSDALNHYMKSDSSKVPYLMLHSYRDIGTVDDYELAIKEGY